MNRISLSLMPQMHAQAWLRATYCGSTFAHYTAKCALRLHDIGVASDAHTPRRRLHIPRDTGPSQRVALSRMRPHNATMWRNRRIASTECSQCGWTHFSTGARNG
jgi:hypothetical protein